MAITTTLSRLKNYFIGWHTANYRTLHEFTDRITDEEPDGSKLVESKTIFQYVTGQINNAKTELTDYFNTLINQLKGEIGEKCDKARASTLWANICDIYYNIGWAADFNGDTWNENPWYPGQGSLWGWIELLRSRTTDLNTRTSGLEKEIKLRIISNKVDTRSQISFYRTGNVVFVHGAFIIKYHKDTTYYNVDILQGSGELDSGHFFKAFVPKESLFFNFNNYFDTNKKGKIYSIQLTNKDETSFEVLFTGDTECQNEIIYFSGAYIANYDISNFPSYDGWYSRVAEKQRDGRYGMFWKKGMVASTVWNDFLWYKNGNNWFDTLPDIPNKITEFYS